MRKTYAKLVLALLLITLNKVNAQVPVAGYSFSQAVSSYTTITGGTVLGTNNNDDQIFDNIPIGFTFNYSGANYTQLSVSANGYLKLLGQLNNGVYSPISDTFGDDTLISALGADIESNVGGVLEYLTTGVTPNQIFIVQWQDYTSYGNSDTINFQIRLHETSNVIEAFYGKTYVDVNYSYEVGLRGILANNDYNNRSVVNSVNQWSTSIAGTSSSDFCELDPNAPLFPTNGLKYVWSPPPPCSGTPNAGTTTVSYTLACVGQTVGLNLINSTIATGLTYQWESSPNASVWTPIATATTMASSAVFTGPVFYRCVVACGSNTAASVSMQVVAQTPNTYTTAPYLENFNNTWQNRCDLRNVPTTAHWQSNPTTGNNSWRRHDDGASANWTTGWGANFPLAGAGCANFNSFDSPYLSTGSMDLFIDLSLPTNYQLSFYHINWSGDDSLEIFLSTDGGSTFTKKASFYSGDYNSIDQNWNKKIVNLGTANSPTCVVRFTGTSDAGGDDIGMDSLKINCTAPTLTVTASQPSVCSGSTVNLFASGATSYTWNTSANTSSINVTPSGNGTYTVYASNTPGCNAAKTVSVLVKPAPFMLFSILPSNTVCTGNTATIICNGADTYSWALGGQTTSIIQVIAPTISTFYNVIGTNTLNGCTTNTGVTLLVAICTELQKQTSTLENIRLFPNPSKGLFTLELNNGLQKHIEVMDLTGRIVLSKQSIEDKTDLNISHLSNGVYYIRLRSNNETKVFKVVKE